MITFKQMEAFYWTGKLGSISAAAGRLSSTQSTLSKRISELERMLDVELFDRAKRAIRLTMKGQELFKIGEETLALQAKIVSTVNDRVTISGTFKFGVTELIAVTLLPAMVGEINKRYPRVELEVEVALGPDLFQKLSNRNIDFVIGPEPPADAPFSSRIVQTVRADWMCSPRLVKQRDLSLEQIGELPVLFHADRSNAQHWLLRWLKRNGVTPTRIIACNSHFALAELAAAGFGVAFLATNYFSPYVRKKRLKIIRSTPPAPALNYFAITRADDNHPLNRMVLDIAIQSASMKESVAVFPAA